MRRLIALLIALAATRVAHADWPAGGRLVCSPDAVNGVRNAHVLDLPSGDLAVLGVGNGGNVNNFSLQRIGRDGTIAPDWPAAGAVFGSVIKGTPIDAQTFVADDSGDVWHGWPNGVSTLGQFVGPGGVRTPAGSPFTVGSNGGNSGRVAPAPGGDAFVACGANRLKRITRTGATAAGWAAAGIALPGASYEDHALAPDGSGGVVVFMRGSASTGTPIATRIDAGSTVHPGWPAGGIALGLPPASPDLAFDSRLLTSGSDHFLAAWTNDAGGGSRMLTLQRFGLDATVDPGWPAGGVPVIASEPFAALTLVPDGAGGVYVLRQRDGAPIATHVTATGALVGAPDASVLDAEAQYVPTWVFGPSAGVIPDQMIADRTPDGGLLVGWNDTRLAPAVSYRLRWLSADLTLAPGTPYAGVVYLPGSPHPTAGSMLALHADSAGGAWIAWADYHDIGSGQVSGDVWMTNVARPTVVDAVAPNARGGRIALSAPRPNPVRDRVALDVVLPDEAPARVELLDLGGSIRRTRPIQGTGAHRVTFGDLDALAPGVYFARLTSGTAARSTRVVVAR